MKISIITVCYNSAKTIEATIESVAAQSYKNVEHIIVDGGSIDGTLEVIRGWNKHAIRLISEPDFGIYDAMNKGIRLATGDIVGILNSNDVYYDGNVLEDVFKVMSDTSIDACYADLIYVAEDNINDIIRYWESCVFKKGLFKTGWAPPHPTFFVRRQLYEKYGLFDLNYPLAADFELMARLLAKHEVSSVYIPKIFIKMRLGGVTNKSVVNVIRQNIEIYKACRKNGVRLFLPFFILAKSISRVRQYYTRPKR